MKYFVLALNAAGVLILGIVASLLLQPARLSRPLPPASTATATVQDDPKALTEAQQALVTLAQLKTHMAQTLPADRENQTLLAHAVSNRQLPTDRAAAPTADEANAPQHQLSVLLDADDGRSAIIDGRLVRPGARLADGSHVSKLGADYAIVRTARGSQTLNLPLRRLRLGNVTHGPAKTVPATTEGLLLVPPLKDREQP